MSVASISGTRMDRSLASTGVMVLTTPSVGTSERDEVRSEIEGLQDKRDGV